ncbi:MAG: carbamoyltransferase HypF [Endozoicomonas sp.]
MTKLTSIMGDPVLQGIYTSECSSEAILDSLDHLLHEQQSSQVVSLSVRVNGTVQGVGFRPFIWQLARETNLSGEVSNDSQGVLILIVGDLGSVREFLKLLPAKSPPLARIESVSINLTERAVNTGGFLIKGSVKGENRTQICSDTASCSQCLADVLNPEDRHYLYPFTNCTHCGPRLSIIEDTPYDRKMTTMSEFPMCGDCRKEYENPADRRFHAQPVACHTCGPQIFYEAINVGDSIPENRSLDHRSAIEHTEACLNEAVKLLKQGGILAVRGIGGFHLCCDATDNEAVEKLRQRKHRYAKPLAVLAPNLEMVEAYCEVAGLEKEQLLSSEAPIVLLDEKQDVSVRPLSRQIAPGSRTVGFMLPYTPLHRLLADRFGGPLVMTSGNPSGVPQILSNEAAREGLQTIADALLLHNRDIANRVDDSVVRCMSGKIRQMRRARGYAPRPFQLPAGFEEATGIVAFGAELKATFCLVKDGKAVVSQHQGDLENLATFEEYEKNLKLYKALYQLEPGCLAIDRHPEYLSSKLARRDAVKENIIEVQHHHAHIASCMVDNNIPLNTAPVLGIALDGLGYGGDGTFWGGEFLLADYFGYRRLGKLTSSPMAGGMKAVLEPWRNTYVQILATVGKEAFQKKYAHTELYQYLQSKPLQVIDGMLNRGVNVPEASSCGRLFDAVAGALGICSDRVSYEGQAAMELEMLVDPELLIDELRVSAYTMIVKGSESAPDGQIIPTLTTACMWQSLLDDLSTNTPTNVIATRFHAALINGIVAMVSNLQSITQFDTVALSGGCFQNRVLFENLVTVLEEKGFNCLAQEQFPANDGGISLGQAVIAAAQALKPKEKSEARNWIENTEEANQKSEALEL